MSRLGPKQILLILLAVALLIAGLSFGSYYFSTEELTARRGGMLAFIPRDYRLFLAEYRLLTGIVATTIVIVSGGVC